MLEPSLESPVTVPTGGGEELFLLVQNLPAFASPEQLVVKIGTSFVSVVSAEPVNYTELGQKLLVQLQEMYGAQIGRAHV